MRHLHLLHLPDVDRALERVILKQRIVELELQLERRHRTTKLRPGHPTPRVVLLIVPNPKRTTPLPNQTGNTGQLLLRQTNNLLRRAKAIQILGHPALFPSSPLELHKANIEENHQHQTSGV